MKSLVCFIIILFSAACNMKAQNVDLIISGLSNEYSSKFLSNKKVIDKQLANLKLPSSVSKVQVVVSYKDGKGWVTMTMKYDHDSIFIPRSRYHGHNNSLGKMAKGVSFLFVDKLMDVLSAYKYEVAEENYLIDRDLIKFQSCIKLVSGENSVQVCAYNYLGDTSREGIYPHTYFKNVKVSYSGKDYQVEPTNTRTLNNMKFFFIGKTIGLDGKPTGAYYFSKFFKIK